MMNKKPKLAIYGDSFSDPSWVQNDYLSWPEMLEQKYNVKNYSLTGSSMWWSYDKFLETHASYDLAIFVVTVPGRIHVEYNNKHLNLNPSTWPVWDGINIGEMYFRYFYSSKRETAFHNFMVNDILQYQDVLVVPAFLESLPNLNSWSLCHYADLELQFYGLDHPGNNENRKCHLTKENNLMIYNKIINAIDNKDQILKLNPEDFVQPADPMECYWK